MSELSSESVLARITTHWSQVSNPVQFVARYAPAIQRYFRVLIRHRQDADDAAQDFLARITARGFSQLTLERGRFRDYLAVAIRNSAINHFRRLQRSKERQVDFLEIESEHTPDQQADAEWLASWRQCILDQAWRGLFHYQRRTTGNLYHTVLKTRSENVGLDDASVAQLVSESSGHPLRPDAFRKQLSRARRMFAEIIVEEVGKTLDRPTPEHVEQELADTGLMSFVRPFLRADWRERGLLSDEEG